MFKEQETTRRNIILQIHQAKTSDALTTYPEVGDDIIVREDFMQIFSKGIIRELLTQLANKLRDFMKDYVKRGIHLSMNRLLNDY